VTGRARVVLGAWAAPAAWCLLLFTLSSVPFRAGSEGFPGADKVVHLAEYAVLGLLVARALLRTDPARRRGRAFALAAAMAGAYGLTDELHQAFVPERAFEVGDLAADAAGAALGAGLWTLAAGRRAISAARGSGSPLPRSGSPPGP